MFGDLTSRLDKIFKDLKGQGILSEKNIKDSLREVRRALLEADVNFALVKDFVKKIQEKAIGEDVLKSLEPGQQVIKIVNQQLIELLGKNKIDIEIHNNKLQKIMLVGLQGSGKTTACSKLGQFYRKKHKPMLVACDIYRPAAIHQLQVLGKQLNIPVISSDEKDVIAIAKKAVTIAEKEMTDLLIFDTAGRLHIDNRMMLELKELKAFLKPDYIFFVADAMTGQDAVTIAKEFNNQLEFDGVILTKMDGDSRGGAALSINAITGKPIIFIGTGEKASDLEYFYPDRMANRILGMGDVLTLIEKAESVIDEKEAEKLAQRLKKNQFTFTDFLTQLNHLKKMGPLENVLKMLPGFDSAQLEGVDLNDNKLQQTEAIILSMTIKERDNPNILNGGRRRRIAKGSGTTVQAVNKLIKSYERMKKMIHSMNKPRKGKRRSKMPF